MLEAPKAPIDRKLSPDDGMYVPGQEAHYFSAGHSAMNNILVAQQAAGLSAPKNILDMACGYGRVMRMLKAYFPAALLTACDIDKTAVDFCGDSFDADKVYGKENFDEIHFSRKFDLIWCGSLLTHLPRSFWESCLRLLVGHLSTDGLLVFTTHGRYVARTITGDGFYYGLEPAQAYELAQEYGRNGFGYCTYPGHAAFGVSISSPPWVVAFIGKQTDLQLCSLNEMGWDQHQDVYACSSIQARVRSDLDDYSARAVEYVVSELGAATLSGWRPSADASEVREQIARCVEKKIALDNLPIGPRVRWILANKAFDEWSSGRKL